MSGFWKQVRELIWERAYELYYMDCARGGFMPPTTPERRELREAGYFYTAKLDILRRLPTEHPQLYELGLRSRNSQKRYRKKREEIRRTIQ